MGLRIRRVQTCRWHQCTGNPASPGYEQAVVVEDDNHGRGVAGSRGVRWDWQAVRDRHAKLKHPRGDGAWDLASLLADDESR